MPKSEWGQYERSPELRAEKSALMKRITEQRWAQDYERTHAISVQNGTTATAYVYQCDECGRVIRGPSIGYHQRATGHQGRTVLFNPYEDSGELA